MSTERLLAIIAVVVVGTVFCVLQVRRALRQPLERDRIVANAILLYNPPARETEPGSAFALQDECELLWSIPEYIDPETEAGLDRLRAALRDEQEGGTS